MEVSVVEAKAKEGGATLDVELEFPARLGSTTLVPDNGRFPTSTKRISVAPLVPIH